MVTALLSTVIVSVLKQHTGVDCPWDLQRYGGDRMVLGLFESRPLSMGRAACFPAGHASAGYGWIAAYFALASVRPGWRWWGLGVGLFTGVVFGFGQQIRGAHFFSHDLWTLTLSWLSAAISARIWLMQSATASAEAFRSRHPARQARIATARRATS